MFDSKEMYRRWARKNVIHATNSVAESNHDITMLFGKNIEDLRSDNFICGELGCCFNRDLVGSQGWPDIKNMLYVMNSTMNYIVLRNYENLPNEVKLGKHSDLDILCDDITIARLVLNAKPTTRTKNRVQHKVQIGDSFLNVDIRHVGDGYYDKTWEMALLCNKKYLEKGFYVADLENYLYTLCYHAIIQKRSISEDYIDRVRKLCVDTGVKLIDLSNEKQAINQLKDYMSIKGFVFTEPKDPTVTYNYFKVDEKATLLRKKQHMKRRVKKLIKKVLGK